MTGIEAEVLAAYRARLEADPVIPVEVARLLTGPDWPDREALKRAILPPHPPGKADARY